MSSDGMLEMHSVSSTFQVLTWLSKPVVAMIFAAHGFHVANVTFFEWASIGTRVL